MIVNSLGRLRRAIRWKRVVSIVLLIAISCGIVGIPISAPTISKQGRFPCEHCACGCASADYCWDKCCCHNDTEKLQWAAKNNVQPPQFLIDRVAAKNRAIGGDLGSAIASVAAPKSCCCANKNASCSVADSSAASTTGEHAATSENDGESVLRIVRIEDAAKCRGIDVFWSVLANVVVDWPTPVLGSFDPPVLFSYGFIDDLALSVISCPDPPAP